MGKHAIFKYLISQVDFECPLTASQGLSSPSLQNQHQELEELGHIAMIGLSQECLSSGFKEVKAHFSLRLSSRAARGGTA